MAPKETEMAIRATLVAKLKRLRSPRTGRARLMKKVKAAGMNHPSLQKLAKRIQVLPAFWNSETSGAEKHWKQMLQYKPESWREHDPASFDSNRFTEGRRPRGLMRLKQSDTSPSIRDQTRVLELLGRVNYRIIQGNRVYVEVGGVVYKTIYGGYWRSVFTGIEHYLLRCEQVSGIWAEDESDSSAIDLPIAFSSDGWTASGHSLSFMVSQE
jgi:hypothetical protein